MTYRYAVDAGLIHDLSSLAPVQVVMPPAAVPVYRAFAATAFRDTSLASALMMMAPVVHKAVHAERSVPASVQALLESLCEMSMAVVNCRDAQQIRAPLVEPGQLGSLAALSAGMYVPGGPRRRLATYSVVLCLS